MVVLGGWEFLMSEVPLYALPHGIAEQTFDRWWLARRGCIPPFRLIYDFIPPFRLIYDCIPPFRLIPDLFTDVEGQIYDLLEGQIYRVRVKYTTC